MKPIVKTALLAGLLAGVGQSAQAGVFVHLFEWKWNDIAAECENVLGPKGYSAVQVSPPQEHIQGPAWWTRYQPVSYKLVSRSGNEQEFASMVSRCKAAGVDIYVDVIWQHMAFGSGTGTAGSSFNTGTLSYPMYSSQDFHHPLCGINPSDYGSNAWRVRNCGLSGLPDLNTGSSYVQQTAANYMNHLMELGVAGFRFDTAKHIDPYEMSAVLARLQQTPKYIFQEVIDPYGSEAIKSTDYTSIGPVTEFKYSANIGDVFKNKKLSYLKTFGTGWGFMASNSAVVFTDNHDNQRGHGAGGANVLTYKNGDLYNLANVFMLAWPYGYPKVMSSYYFDDGDQGPPGASARECQKNGWVCEHRWGDIANMVAFRNKTDGQGMTHWWDNGNNQIAFGRNGKGFVVINREGSAMSVELPTGMPDGKYGSVTGDKQCVTVSGGKARFDVGSMKAAAIYLGKGCGDNPDPVGWENAYFRGTPNSWAATAMTKGEGNLWTYKATFGSDNPRFKISRYTDWTVAVPATDYLITGGAGTYTITFDGSSATIVSVTKSGDEPQPGTATVNFTCQNGTTSLGQSVYVVGDDASLGSWAPASAVKLNPTSYPTWTGAISVPANKTISWKCIKRSETSATTNLVWQSGGNNTVTTGASGSSASSTGSF